MGKEHWAPKMREKIKFAKQELNEAKRSKNLNTEKFYLDNQIKNRWVRISESSDEIKEFFL
jgi:hypothetical protein